MSLSDHDDPVNEKPSGPVKVNPFQRKTEVRNGIAFPKIWGFLFSCDIIRDKGFIIQLFSYSSLSTQCVLNLLKCHFRNFTNFSAIQGVKVFLLWFLIGSMFFSSTLIGSCDNFGLFFTTLERNWLLLTLWFFLFVRYRWIIWWWRRGPVLHWGWNGQWSYKE